MHRQLRLQSNDLQFWTENFWCTRWGNDNLLGFLRTAFWTAAGVWHNTIEAYSSNVTAVVNYLQFNRKKLPFLIWRDNTPQHFDTPLGEFGCDGCPEPHVPYQCKVRAYTNTLTCLRHAPIQLHNSPLPRDIPSTTHQCWFAANWGRGAGCTEQPGGHWPLETGQKVTSANTVYVLAETRIST